MGGQDAHPTRKLILCGTGILPVRENILPVHENGARYEMHPTSQ